MAKMPSGSSLIYNPSSAAPGFKIKNVLCLPGVPSILKSMAGSLKKYLIKGRVVSEKSISLYTVESNIALQLEKIQKKYIIQETNDKLTNELKIHCESISFSTLKKCICEKEERIRLLEEGKKYATLFLSD